MAWANSPGDSSAGSIRCARDAPGIHVLAQIDSQRRAAGHERGLALVEDEQSGMLASRGSSGCKLRGERRFSRSRCADDQGAGAALEATAEQLVELGQTAGEPLIDARLAVLGRDQARKHFQAAANDDVVVIAAAEVHAAILEHPQPPPVGAVFRSQLLETNDAVRNALHLQIALRPS